MSIQGTATEGETEATATTFEERVESDAVHTGSGDQYVYQIHHSVIDSVREQAKGPRFTHKDDLRWLQRRFVEPGNFDEARKKLRSGTVLLTGVAGSGRRTAAKMLVTESADDNAPYSLLDEEAHLPDSWLTNVKVELDHRLVLDLTDSSEDVLRKRLRELPDFRTQLAHSQAVLALVLPEEDLNHLEPELGQFVVHLDRPRGAAVLHRHLNAAGLCTADQKIDFSPVGQHLDAAVAEVVKVAERVVQARDALPDASLASWLGEAVSGPFEHGTDIREQLEGHTDSRDRATLFAAAMCRGASSDAVFFAAHLLVNNTRDVSLRLTQRGYRTQLDSLTIDVSAHDSIEFCKIAYDQRLREHFWDNYPDLRESFAKWVDEVIRMRQLTGDDRLRLVDRFTAQALRTGSPNQVSSLVEKWIRTKPSGSNPLRDFGVRALITGLQDVRYGSHFRRLVYEWACDHRLSAEAGEVVVNVTAEVIAPNHPDRAVVRLHHRARHENGQTARTALADLVDQGVRQREYLIERLARGLTKNAPFEQDYVLFLDAANPGPLTWGKRPPLANGSSRAHLTTCWRALMTHRPDLASELFPQWLSTAARLRSYDLMLGVLVNAASASIKLLGQLYVAARDWSGGCDGDADVVSRLTQLIDMAQGLHPSDYTYPSTEELI